MIVAIALHLAVAELEEVVDPALASDQPILDDKNI